MIHDVSQHPLFSNVLGTWKSVDNEDENLHAMLSVPLKRGSQVIGVFNVAFGKDSQITDEDATLS